MTRKLKRPIALLLSLTMLVTMMFTGTFVMTASAETINTMTPLKPATGSGSSADPYEISSAAELYWFAGLVNGDVTVCDYDADTNPDGTQQNTAAHAKLTANIVVNEGDVANCGGTKGDDGWYDWMPIGNSSNRYTGTFNGDNHTISGLYFNDDTQSYVGLFGFADSSSANISNLGIENSYFNANQYVGGVCGNVYSGSTVSNCYNTGTVTGAKDVGGVCGRNYKGTISNCYNTGTVSGSGSYVGGVCGQLENNGTVSNCYNTGAVSGSSDVGGVCGGNQGYGPGTISNCYNAGSVSGSSDVGKVCGDSDGTVSNCYYLADADDNSGGKTQAQFSSGEVAYFLSQGDNASWGQNIDNGEDNQSFPVLDGAKVYRICDSGAITYTNDDTKVNNHNFDFHDGICACGEGRAAVYDEEGGYYKIEDSGNLYWFASLVNGTLDGTDRDSDANAKLMNNITVNTGDVAGCNGKKGEGWFDWTPIGKDTTTPYQGKFNGDGYTVSGLYFNNTAKDYVGLFGYVTGSNANISNLGIKDSYFKANQYVGGVCGYNSGTISNCYNAGTVSGTGANVGGVCGRNNNGTIKFCYNKGTVSGSGEQFGGVCGYNSGTISNCYNTGAVKGYRYVGGVCGENSYSTIEYCYSIGTVSASSSLGYSAGVSGWNYYGTIENCYYDNEIFTGSAVSRKDGGTVSSVNGMATADFASGEIAYLLQGNQTENIWGQIIDIEGKDAESYPVLSENRVYKVCNQGVFDYSNTSDSNNHLYNNDGYCACGEIQPANLNEGVYEIGNVGQLYWFAGLVNGTLIDGTPQNTAANAKLTADIVVNKGETDDAVASCNGTKGDGWKDWTPIGSGSNNYIGTFNGNNHTISGLYFNDDAQNNVGLFGNIHDKNAKVYDLGILDSYFKGNYYVGGVCGYNYYGTIENCYNEGTVNGKSDYVGGVCGYNDRGTITGCHNKGAVSGSGNVGGVCGENRFFTPTDSLITKCYNEGEIVGLGNVGGVCGQNNGGTVSDCYSTGAVSSTNSGSPKVGGVCGHNNSGTVSNCYSIGTVSDDNSTTAVLGAVCGNNSGTITNCYYDNQIFTENAVGNDTGTCNEDAGMATADFESGKVACALQGEQETNIWGQSIDEAPIDTHPVLGGKRVYYGYFSCDVNVDPDYTNIESNATERPAHKYDENGFCKVCGVYEPALKNDSGVYEIGNAGQLYWFAGLVNGDKTVCDYDSSSNPDGTRQNSSANAILTDNIVVNEGDIANYNGEDTVSWRTWTPIGNDSIYYTGTFNGDNHTISGLYFNDDSQKNVGLFGRIAGAGTTSISISNVHIINSYFKANNYVGGVFGYTCYANGYRAQKTIENCTNSGTVIGNSYVGGVCGYTSFNTTIKNCQNTGTVSGTGNNVGGVCGYNYEAKITNCSNTGAVSGSGNVGGVCAYNRYESITGCYNTGAVIGTGDNVGGVCGEVSSGTITGCYNTGTVSGSSYVGGVSGCNEGYQTASIKNCYNKGAVSGKVDYVGGVSGCAANGIESIGSITNCYNTGTVSCESEDSTNVGDVSGCLAADKNATGSITNCYYLVADGTVEEKDDFDGTTFKTAAEFASGEVAFLLRATKEDKIWGQDLANNELYPALNNKQVYRVCTGASLVYSNDLGDESHDFDADGFCEYCGAYKPAVKNGDGVYEIELAGQLYWFASLVNGTLDGTAQDKFANAKLMNNIVVNEGNVADCGGTKGDGWKDWTPIGNDSNNYRGTFDGQNYTISGLYFNNGGQSYAGLFGYIYYASVSNVGVVNSYINGKMYVGGVCGYNNYGTIEKCYNEGTVSGSDTFVGGVCGYIHESNSSIKNCYNKGTVIGSSKVGGVCGYNNYGTITDSHNEGAVSSTCYGADAADIGGVCGYSDSGTITGCYNKGTVSGSNHHVGGVCGFNVYGTITGCHNEGAVSGPNNYIGGVCGYISVSDTSINNCYNEGTVSLRRNANYIGGVFGYFGGSNSSIENCYNKGEVSLCEDAYDANYIGGVCGNLSGSNTSIKNCYNKGELNVSVARFSGTISSIGGVCGYLSESDSSITNCYNTGVLNVTAEEYTNESIDKFGGVCGNNNGGTIANCHSTSALNVTASEHATVSSSNVGGVCGYNVVSTGTAEIKNCYYDSTVFDVSAIGGDDSENSEANGGDNVLGKTTAEFASGEVAYLLNQNDGLEDDVWGQNIDNGETPDAYPVLGGATVKYVDVYGQCENEPGESTGKQYSNKDAVYADHTDNDNDCICDNCGNVVESSLKVSATMVNGASIRLTNGNGLRFYTMVDSAKIAELQSLGATVELGTLIAPKDLLGEDDLTFESSKYIDVKYEAIEDGAYYWHKDVEGQIAGSIVNIKESNTSFSTANGNIAREFVGRGYVKVTLNCRTEITYASYASGDIANNTRSLAYVANALKNDTAKYDALDNDTKSLVDNWASKLTN